MVDFVRDEGPRNRIVSVCVSERLDRAVRARSGRTGESRSEIMCGLLDSTSVNELLEDEAARAAGRGASIRLADLTRLRIDSAAS